MHTRVMIENTPSYSLVYHLHIQTAFRWAMEEKDPPLTAVVRSMGFEVAVLMMKRASAVTVGKVRTEVIEAEGEQVFLTAVELW